MANSYKIAIYPQNVATIKFGGVIDGSLAQKAIEECLSRQCASIIIDLSDVTHAQSNALGVFVGMKATSEQRAGRIVFVEPQGAVAIALDMMGFREIFRYYPSISTALREMIHDPGNTRRITL